MPVSYIECTNVSVYNTTIYFIYIKQYIDSATCFDLHWVRKQIQDYIDVLQKRIARFCKTSM